MYLAYSTWSKHLTREAGQSKSPLTLTCSAFLSPAFGELWSTLRYLEYLIELLPESLLDRNVQQEACSSHNDLNLEGEDSDEERQDDDEGQRTNQTAQYTFLRPFSPSDWGRLGINGVHVRQLTLFVHSARYTNLLQQNDYAMFISALNARTTPVFPHLRDLTVGAWTWIYPMTRHARRPCLERF